MQPTVVIIDDDTDDVELLELLVAELQPRHIMSFTESIKAVTELTSAQILPIPTHVFVDYNMPLMDGAACVKAFRNDRRFDNTRIAVLSTSMNEDDQRMFTGIGANYALTKPARIAEYRLMVRAVLGAG